MRTWKSLVAAGVSCLFLASSTCHAGTIYACKKKVGGTVRIVDDAATQCLATETRMSWPDSAEVAALKRRLAAVESLLQHFSRNGNDISITGANLWVKDGSGDTGGPVNGLGNLILGYNEARGAGDDRTGSHNLVVGSWLNFSSYGGLVAGYYNTISAPYATVSGGTLNTASGSHSSVSGGSKNLAKGNGSSVSGGHTNIASSFFSSVSGGYDNTASGRRSSVSGGNRNIANGFISSVCGGQGNIAVGVASSVSGGEGNTAGGYASSLSGGYFNIASGDSSSVSGGASNVAGGHRSSVSGGFERSVSGYHDWAAGGLFEEQ